MKKLFLISFVPFLILVFFSCSDDDQEGVMLKNKKGIVLGPVSCNSDTGLAYSIRVEGLNLQNSNFIITANLPEEFKMEGIQIVFDMENSNDGITFCTANFFPEQFYKLSNVKPLNQEP